MAETQRTKLRRERRSIAKHSDRQPDAERRADYQSQRQELLRVREQNDDEEAAARGLTQDKHECWVNLTPTEMLLPRPRFSERC